MSDIKIEKKRDYNEERQIHEKETLAYIEPIFKNTKYYDFLIGDRSVEQLDKFDPKNISILRGEISDKTKQLNKLGPKKSKNTQQQSFQPKIQQPEQPEQPKTQQPEQPKTQQTQAQTQQTTQQIDQQANQQATEQTIEQTGQQTNQQNNDLESQISKLKTDLQTLRKQLKEAENIHKLYTNRVKKLSIPSKELSRNTEQKCNTLAQKILYLYETDENFKNVFPDKNVALNIPPLKFGDYSIETLTKKEDMVNIPLLGSINSCCLSFNESGNKYVLAGLFDPNVSITLVKNKEGQIVSTALTIYNEETKTISIVHIDIAKYANIEGKTLKGLFDVYGQFIIEKDPNKKFIVFPGEQTFANINYNVSGIEKELSYLVKLYNPEQLPSIKNIKQDAEWGSRTGAKNPTLTYILENPHLFDPAVVNYVTDNIEFITNSVVSVSDPKDILFPKNYNDRFNITNDSGGHSISHFTFDYRKQIERNLGHLESPVIIDSNQQNYNPTYKKLLERFTELYNANLDDGFNDLYDDLNLQKKQPIILDDFKKSNQELAEKTSSLFI